MAVNDPNYRYATRTYPADGVQTDFEIAFDGGYIRQADVVAYSEVLDDETGLYIDRTAHALVFLSEEPAASTNWNVATVRIEPAIADGRRLTVARSTEKAAPLVDYSSGALLTERNLDLSNQQSTFGIAEIHDRLGQAEVLAQTAYDAVQTIEGNPINLSFLVNRPELAATTGPALIGTSRPEAPAFLQTLSHLLQGVPVSWLENINPNRHEDIKNGDDVDDTAEALMDMVLNLDANNVRRSRIMVPRGAFTIHQPIQFVQDGNIPGFVLEGEDRLRSVIRRGSDWAAEDGTGSVFNISGVEWIKIHNLSIDGGYDLYPVRANHGIAVSNTKHSYFSHLHVTNFKNTGILVFHFPGLPVPPAPVEDNNWVDHCYIDGMGAANNGILLGDQFNSGMRHCTVLNLDKSGSPSYALQFKNRCYNSKIENCIAIGARVGIAFGQEDVTGVAAEYCHVSDVIVRDCTWGINMGNTAYSSISDVNIDMSGVGSNGIEMTDCVQNALKDIKMRNQQISSAYSVKFGGASTDNVVEFSILDVQDTIPEIARFESATLNNHVHVEKLMNSGTFAFSGQCASDQAAGVSGNSLSIGGRDIQESYVIASGVITMKHSRVETLRADTEASAATDDLDTITGVGRDGQLIVIKTSNNARDITVKHGTGNILLNLGKDCALTGVEMCLVLKYVSGTSKWVEVCRSTVTLTNEPLTSVLTQGTSRTVITTDNQKVILTTAASVTLTFAASSPTGMMVTVATGADASTLVAGSGATIYRAGTAGSISLGARSQVTLVKVNATDWQA